MSNELAKQNQPYNLFKDPRMMRACYYCGQDLYHAGGCLYNKHTMIWSGSAWRQWELTTPVLEDQLAPEKNPNE